ncbi:peptidoglycan-binding protein [Priestia megaterium]|uniref:peptidoglycan-binding protein n=1 Tax=Priestia megaterium TaxID=1404 RepID=UPI003CC68B7A
MVELQYLLDRSEKQLEGVHATVAGKAIELVKKAYDKGIAIAVTQGYRSIEYQNGLYAQGRTKPGKKVTNAKGGSSYHNFGLAFDFCVFDDNKQPCWDGKEYDIVGQMGKDLGLEWGGNFKSIKDKPHFQITFGFTLAQLRAGKRPAGSATVSTPKQSNLLENGASGSAVKELQEKLIKLGYELGKIDSQFGKLTDKAVRKFQKDNKLGVDGIAGTKTLAMLDSLVKALDVKKEEIKVEPAKEVVKPVEEKKAEAVKEVVKKVEEVKENPIPKIISLGDKYSFQVEAKKNTTVYGKANLTEKGKTLKKGNLFSVYGYDAEGNVYAVGGGGFVAQADVEPVLQEARTGGMNSLMELEIRKYFKDNNIEAYLIMPSKGNPSVHIEAKGLCMVSVRRFLDDKGWYYKIK